MPHRNSKLCILKTLKEDADKAVGKEEHSYGAH